jgi:histidinol-phosphate aminotransferase
MIDVYEKFNKAKSCKVDYDVNRKLNIDNFVKQINSNSFVYIANPDNPTGIELSLVQLQSIIQKAKKKDVFVLLDETYKAFSKNNFQFYNEPNVISVGSFSKSHGLAGIRLGYVVADPKVIDIIKKLRSIDEVNSVAAKECIKLNNKIKDKNVKNVKKWKRIFQKTFPKHYRETSTNFIILKFKEPKHIYLYKKLYENKILTRADFEHISMSGVLRITVSTNSQMKKVLQILKREI